MRRSENTNDLEEHRVSEESKSLRSGPNMASAVMCAVPHCEVCWSYKVTGLVYFASVTARRPVNESCCSSPAHETQ